MIIKNKSRFIAEDDYSTSTYTDNFEDYNDYDGVPEVPEDIEGQYISKTGFSCSHLNQKLNEIII